jgi:hypothetical protein
MIDQNQPENVEYFNYFGSMITDKAKCTRQIKSRICMAQTAFNKKQKKSKILGLKFKEEISNVLQLEHNFVSC